MSPMDKAMRVADIPDWEKQQILVQLLEAYEQDQERFRQALPLVAQRLDALANKGSRMWLTGDQRKRLLYAVKNRLDRADSLSDEEFLDLLRDFGLLALERRIPSRLPRQRVAQLLKDRLHLSYSVAGKGGTTKQLQPGIATVVLPVVRGVDIHFSKEWTPIAVSVTPSEILRKQEAMALVGMFSDAPEVAERHDDYLSQIDPHGRDNTH